MGKTLRQNDSGSVEECGEPKVEYVVCNNGHRNQPSSGEGKVALGAAKVPCTMGLLHHTHSTIFGVRAFAPSIRSEKRVSICANSRLSLVLLSPKMAVRLVSTT